MTYNSASIISVGSYLPDKILMNEDLSQFFETSDEWIRTRTGILQRHMIATDEMTSDMAVEAAKIAIDRAGINPQDIDLIINATTTPDKTMPSNAALIQAKLGINQCGVFDLQAVCAGFIYALTIANQFITLGNAKTILVIGADAMTRTVDWQDRRTAILFGDGAGAVIMQAAKSENQGILASDICGDGSLEPILYANGGTFTDNCGKIIMDGGQVFKHAVQKMSESILNTCAKVGISVNDIDWLVPHQANTRIIEAIGQRIGINKDKVVITANKHANTSAASIPLALDYAVTSGLIKPGQIVVMTALGSGLVWGSVVIRW